MTDSGRYQLLFRFFCELTSGSISDKLLQSVSIALLAYQTKPRGSHRKDLNESDIIPNPVGRKTFSREITYILYNHQSRVISLESPKRCALCKLLFHAYNHFLLIYVVDACSFLTLASWKHPVSFSKLPMLSLPQDKFSRNIRFSKCTDTGLLFQKKIFQSSRLGMIHFGEIIFCNCSCVPLSWIIASPQTTSGIVNFQII